MEKFEKVYDVFISYSDKDRKIVSAICNKLENYGIRCWVAYRDIPPGKKWSGAISAAIKRSSILLLVFSSNSNKSNEVEKEIGLGTKHCDTIIPFRIEDISLSDELEYHLSNVHWLDSLSEPREQQIAELSERIINSLPNRKKEIEEAAKRKIAEAEAKAERLARVEEDRQRAEAEAKAEAERLASEEADRQKAETEAKAEAERLASEEAERQRMVAKAKAEAERLASEEEERQRVEAKVKAEAERLAREEEQRQREEAEAKAEAERLAYEEADRKRAEAKAMVEAQRLAKEEADRKRAEAEAMAAAERLAREEVDRQRVEAKAEAERLAYEEADHQKEEVEESPFIEWKDRQEHADVKKNVLKDAGIDKRETGTKEGDNENSTNKDELKKKKEKEIIYVISKLKFLHFLDTVIVIYSIAALLSLMVNKFVEIPYYTPPTFKTAIFLLTLSTLNKWSKKAKDGSDPAIFSGITYMLLSTPITYYFTVLITKDWPWILPYSYFVTVPIFWFIVGVFVLGLRDEQFFITRFSTGCIFGFWSAVFYESYKLKHVDLSLGIQEVIGNHGFALLGFGVICIMFNRASKILSRENNTEKTLTIEKVI